MTLDRFLFLIKVHVKHPVRDGLAILFGLLFAHSMLVGPSAWDDVLTHIISDTTLGTMQFYGALFGGIIGMVCLQDSFQTTRYRGHRTEFWKKLDDGGRSAIAWTMIGIGLGPILAALFVLLLTFLDFAMNNPDGAKAALGALVVAAIAGLIICSVWRSAASVRRSRRERY